MNSVLKGLGLLIALGAIFGGAYWLFFADNGAHSPLNSVDYVNVRVESTHILLSADFKLYIDDEEIESWRMGPSGVAEFAFSYTMPKTNAPKYISIKVISTGGGFGQQQDFKLILVGKGQTHNITLRA